MIDPNDKTRFEPFTIHATSYKTVDDQPIRVDVLYPTKLLKDGQKLATPRPTILRFHGGGLVTGDSMYPGFFAEWLLELALKHDAIIVSPNNQLFPEASPADILSDVSDIWKWVHSSLPTFLNAESNGIVTKVNLSQIMVSGESAGGFLSLMLALEQPDAIRAVLAQYPMIDLKSAHFSEAYDKKPFGMPIDQFPKSAVADALEKAQEYKERTGKRLVVSEDPMLTRMPVMFASLLHGVFPDFILGKERGEDMYIYDRLRRGDRLPTGGIFVWHGNEDSVVPVQGSHELEKVVRETNPQAKFSLNVQPGEHGFDGETKLADDWVKGLIAEVEQAWLG